MPLLRPFEERDIKTGYKPFSGRGSKSRSTPKSTPQSIPRYKSSYISSYKPVPTKKYTRTPERKEPSDTPFTDLVRSTVQAQQKEFRRREEVVQKYKPQFSPSLSRFEKPETQRNLKEIREINRLESRFAKKMEKTTYGEDILKNAELEWKSFAISMSNYGAKGWRFGTRLGRFIEDKGTDRLFESDVMKRADERMKANVEELGRISNRLYDELGVPDYRQTGDPDKFNLRRDVLNRRTITTELIPSMLMLSTELAMGLGGASLAKTTLSASGILSRLPLKIQKTTNAVTQLGVGATAMSTREVISAQQDAYDTNIEQGYSKDTANKRANKAAWDTYLTSAPLNMLQVAPLFKSLGIFLMNKGIPKSAKKTFAEAVKKKVWQVGKTGTISAGSEGLQEAQQGLIQREAVRPLAEVPTIGVFNPGKIAKGIVEGDRDVWTDAVSGMLIGGVVSGATASFMPLDLQFVNDKQLAKIEANPEIVEPITDQEVFTLRKTPEVSKLVKEYKEKKERDDLNFPGFGEVRRPSIKIEDPTTGKVVLESVRETITIREIFNTDSIAKYFPGEEVGKTLNNGEYAYAMAEAIMVGMSEKNKLFENRHSLAFIIQETRGDIIQAILDGQKMYRAEKYNVKLPTLAEVAVKIRAIEKRVNKREEMETDTFDIDGETFKIGRGTPLRVAEQVLEDHPSMTAEKDELVHVRLSEDKEYRKTGIRARDLRIKEVEKLENQEDIEKEGYDAQIPKGKQTLIISRKRLDEIRKEHSTRELLRVVKNNPVAVQMMKAGIIEFTDLANSIGYGKHSGLTKSISVEGRKKFPMKIFIDVNDTNETIEHEMGHFFLRYMELTGAMTPEQIERLKREVLNLVGDRKLDEKDLPHLSESKRQEEEVVQLLARILRDLDSKGHKVPIIKQALEEYQDYNKEITVFRKLMRDEVFGEKFIRDLDQRMVGEYLEREERGENLTKSEIYDKVFTSKETEKIIEKDKLSKEDMAKLGKEGFKLYKELKTSEEKRAKLKVGNTLGNKFQEEYEGYVKREKEIMKKLGKISEDINKEKTEKKAISDKKIDKLEQDNVRLGKEELKLRKVVETLEEKTAKLEADNTLRKEFEEESKGHVRKEEEIMKKLGKINEDIKAEKELSDKNISNIEQEGLRLRNELETSEEKGGRKKINEDTNKEKKEEKDRSDKKIAKLEEEGLELDKELEGLKEEMAKLTAKLEVVDNTLRKRSKEESKKKYKEHMKVAMKREKEVKKQLEKISKDIEAEKGMLDKNVAELEKEELRLRKQLEGLKEKMAKLKAKLEVEDGKISLSEEEYKEHVKKERGIVKKLRKIKVFSLEKRMIGTEDLSKIEKAIGELLSGTEKGKDPNIYILTVDMTYKTISRMMYSKGKITKKRFIAGFTENILGHTTQARPGSFFHGKKEQQGERTVGVYVQGKNNEHTEEIIKEYNTNKEDGKGYIGTYTVEDGKIKNIVDATQIYLKGNQKKTVLAKKATNLIVKRMLDVEDDLTIPDGKTFLEKNYAQYIDSTQDSLEGMLRDKEEATTAELVSDEYPHIVEGKGRIIFSKESAPLARKYTEQIETKIEEETQKGTKTPLDTPEERLKFLAKENGLFVDGSINFGKKAEIYKEAKQYNRKGKIYKEFMDGVRSRNYNVKKVKGGTEGKVNEEIGKEKNNIDSEVVGELPTRKKKSVVKKVLGDTKDFVIKSIIRVDDRIGDISSEVSLNVSRREHNIETQRNKVLKEIFDPFNKGFQALKKKLPQTTDKLDLALFNDDTDTARQIADKNGFLSALNTVYDYLQEDGEVLLTMSLIETKNPNYFPRLMIDHDSFVKLFDQEGKHKNKRIEAFNKKREAHLKKNENMEPSVEQMNMWKRDIFMQQDKQTGDITGDIKSSILKSRTVQEVTPEMLPLYAHANAALEKYIDSSIKAKETAKFLGFRGTKNVILKEEDVTLEDGNWEGRINIEDSVPKLIYDLLPQLPTEKTEELIHLVKIGLNQKPTGLLTSIYRHTSYLTLLAQPKTALVQILDSVLTAQRDGLISLATGILKQLGLAKKNGALHVNVKDLWLDAHATEQAEGERRNKWINAPLFMVRGMDKFMKNISLKSMVVNWDKQIEKAQREKPVKGDPDSKEKAMILEKKDGKVTTVKILKPEEINIRYLMQFKEEEQQNLIRDIVNRDRNKNTDFLMALHLNGTHGHLPSSKPEFFIKNPEWRFAYTLKTFNILFGNFQLKEIIQKNPWNKIQNTPIERTKQILKIFFIVAALGLPAHTIRQIFLTGKFDPDHSIPKRLWDAFWRMMPISRYDVGEIAETGPFNVVPDIIRPISTPGADLWGIGHSLVTGEEVKGEKALKYVPFVGDLLYNMEEINEAIDNAFN